MLDKQNKGIIFSVIFFIAITIIFYFMGIGYKIQIEGDDIKRKFDLKVPAAYALLFWAIYYLISSTNKNHKPESKVKTDIWI